MKITPLQATGLAVMLLNCWWLWHNAQRWYSQHFEDVLFFYLLPDWLLYMKMTFALVGIGAGVQVFRRKMKELTGLLCAVLLMTSAFVIEVIVTGDTGFIRLL